MKDYERLTEKSIGCFKYTLKDHKPKAGEFNDYEAFYNYSTAVKILGELEDKIESGEIVDRNAYLDYLMSTKNVSEVTNKEIEFFAKHNARVREYVDAEISRLTAENDKLRARLQNAIELPCKVGDKIYNILGLEPMEWEVEKIMLVKDGYFLQCGHKGTDDFMVVSNKEYGEWWFTDRIKAEAKLKEKGGNE